MRIVVAADTVEVVVVVVEGQFSFIYSCGLWNDHLFQRVQVQRNHLEQLIH